MAFFCGHQWKAFAEIETSLVTEHASRAGAGTVTFIISRVNNMPEKLKILLHGLQVKSLSAKAYKRPAIFNNKIAAEM